MNPKRASSKVKQKYHHPTTQAARNQDVRGADQENGIKTICFEDAGRVTEENEGVEVTIQWVSNYESTISRWRKATNSDAPLKDYAKKVLADRKQALKKFGID